MIEAQRTAEAAREEGADARVPAAADAATSDAAASQAAVPGSGVSDSGVSGPSSGPWSAAVSGRASGSAAASSEEPEPPDALVDARLVESAILALRKPIVAATLPFEDVGVEEARAERRKLLSQIDDYLLPRLRESGSPILVALVGSTGAGKSTLVNSLVGAEVSVTGIRRPTTNSPVLACHPDDVGWFAENVFLPTVPRVRQEGLARSGRDGLLVLAASEGMPKGVALLDTPDIDSVVRAHRDFAHQFLDASDLWLFMTTAGRYADAAVWDMLQHARDRGASLGVVLSRLPDGGEAVATHFAAMLEANGLGDRQRFVIPETVLSGGRLPAEVSRPVREWLESAADQMERRVAVLTQTMSGMLDTLRSRVPALAAQVEAQAALRADLSSAVDGAYRAALAELEQSLWDGSMLRGEVLACWQELAGTGDLLQALQSRRGVRSRRQRGTDRVQALKAALRAAIESLVRSVGDRVAEDAVGRWRDHPAGAALLDQPPASAEGPGRGAGLALDMSVLFGADAAGPQGPAEAAQGAPEGGAPALTRSSPELIRHAARAVSAWQDQLARVIREEIVTKRSIARSVALDEDSLAAVLMVATLAAEAPEPETGTGSIPRRLLTTLFGEGPLRHLISRARSDLLERIRLILEEEMLRFAEVLDGCAAPDAAVAVRLYQAIYSLEVVR